jgi:tRNA-binding EMAP/Myf-like protein
MKVSAKTLKQISGISNTLEEIPHLIEEHISAVDGTHDMSKDYEGIVVAEIVEKKEHPDADKLGVYQIEYAADEPIQVIAGDKTLEVGDKVLFLHRRRTIHNWSKKNERINVQWNVRL